MTSYGWTGSGELNNGEVIWSGEEKDHQRGGGISVELKGKVGITRIQASELQDNCG